MNKSLIISLIVLIFVGIGVSRVKYEVVFLRKSLNETNSKIEKCQDDMRVLGAEWSYLNDPKRLRKLCEKYLPAMKPMENTQVVSYNKIIGSDYEEQFSSNRAFNSFLDDALSDEKETEG